MSIEIRELNVRTELVNSYEPEISGELYKMEQRIIKRVMAEYESQERRRTQAASGR
jgi:hypothetical protein